MIVRTRLFETALLTLGLTLPFTATVTAAQAADSFATPTVIVDPSPVEPIPSEPVAPVDPPAFNASPSGALPPPSPGTPGSGATNIGPVMVPRVVVPPAVMDPAVPGVRESSEPTGAANPSSDDAAESSTPAAAPALSPAPAALTSELQAGVAAVTGSPPGVQMLTVLILLAAGYGYFRFMGSKTGIAPKRSAK
jgi:hypothetical protein